MDGEQTYEDQINRLLESRKLLPNASYFALTGTPKNKTREFFGAPERQLDGTRFLKMIIPSRKPTHDYRTAFLRFSASRTVSGT